jgi:hypothetical protein
MKTEEQTVIEELYDRDKRRVKNEEYLLDRVSKIKKPQKSTNYPDAKKHQIVSFIKSGIRIIGYIFIPFDLIAAAAILVVSEGIGIIEEMV